jgi:hypothetical protein
MKTGFGLVIIAVGLLAYVLLPTAAIAQPLPPGGGGDSTNPPPPFGGGGGNPHDYGTNLWLETAGVSNGALNLVLHNTQPDVPYELLSIQTLKDTQWVSEGMVTGLQSAVSTPASVAMNNRSSLFVKALAHAVPAVIVDTNVDSNGNGIPDWWELKYFGSLQAGGADYDSDGVVNLQEYQNGTDPNKVQFSLSTTNQYVNASQVPVQINVSAGVPASMAVLVDSKNYNAAVWQPFNTNLTVNLGSVEGWHDVWVGLRGLRVDGHQTWVWINFKLSFTSPVLVVTNSP